MNGALGDETGAAVRRAVWDRHSRWWRETFTGGVDPEYELEILPIVERELAGCRRILDLGCGEGQVARRLLAGGGPGDGGYGAASGGAADRTPWVVGIDVSATQLGQAQDQARVEAQAPVLVRGEGERLPFAPGSFDGAVCSLVIEHAEDVDAVLGEVGRVLSADGRFVLLINHPLYQGPGSGFVDDQILGERYWRVGPYLVEDVSWEEVDAGVRIPFAHRPLSRYVNPLADHDLVMTLMLEPSPPAELLATSLDRELEEAIPRLLAMRFDRRRPAPPRPQVP